MNTSKTVLAAIAGLCLFATSAQAVLAPAEIQLTVSDATGLPGSIVFPTISFPINGFEFDSLTLTLTYDASVLAFQAGASTVTLNGASQALTSLPNYFAGAPTTVGGLQQTVYSAFSVNSVPVTGALVLTGSFQILGGAASGLYPVVFSGSVSTGPGPAFDEPDFSSQLSVAVVPEPETWLLWIGGIGMLATRVIRRRRQVVAS